MLRLRSFAALRTRRSDARRRFSVLNNDQKSVLMDNAVRKLEASGVPDAKISAQLLYDASKGSTTVFHKFIERRSKREPLQYIIGDWDFHNITLFTRSPILIPRPETEELVEFVLSRHNPSVHTDILDIGTGTGAIGLALCHANPNFHCTGIDSDSRACALATLNAEQLNLSDRYSTKNVDIQNYRTESTKGFDLIVSNPPYIPSHELENLQPEVGLYESRTALDGGSDGGEIPRTVITRSLDLLKEGGELFLELHYSHDQIVVEAWIQSLGIDMYLVESRKDMQGIQRFHRIAKAPK